MSDNKEEECKHEETVVINYDPMWHDGQVVCKKCKKYIREFDGG
jgi:hypothetical protein